MANRNNVSVNVSHMRERERERETERDRQTDRDRHRYRQTDIQTAIQTDRDRERERKRETDREADKQRPSEREDAMRVEYASPLLLLIHRFLQTVLWYYLFLRRRLFWQGSLSKHFQNRKLCDHPLEHEG